MMLRKKCKKTVDFMRNSTYNDILDRNWEISERIYNGYTGTNIFDTRGETYVFIR